MHKAGGGVIYAVYHSPTETAGLVGRALKELKLSFKEIRPFGGQAIPKNPPELEALILMGGPMNADETKKYPYLAEEVKLIENMVKDGKPVLGICLGSQLIAKALGSKVYANKAREVGWKPLELSMQGIMDPLFKEFPNNTKVLHWHGDTFDLPKGAVHLASTELCKNQAFSYGKSVYALQFHLEATPEMVANWVETDEAYIRGAKESPDDILEDTPVAFKELDPVARELLKSYFSALAAKG
ncbi:MAG: hypothetical protein A3A86_03075 [Elusimicrobia bacterium RIFCSPLOWO2_01_FULL_60_11]|nr:MAG: hypothetical protein A3A86_03075 [Elusimicrobia bacterium RIFCSPLOWO2_01_FULL_60_11]